MKTFFFSPDVQAQFDNVEQRASEFYETFQLVMGYPPGPMDFAQHYLGGLRKLREVSA
jgi:hypothetical protein